MDEPTFLAAIVDDPDDPGPWLVYADWLMEQGDPRGEFLQLNVELAGCTPDDRTRRNEILEDLKRLDIEHGDLTGLGHVRSSIPDWRYGFAMSVRGTAGRVLQLERELLRHPVATIHLQGFQGRGRELGSSAILPSVRRLTLHTRENRAVPDERRMEVEELAAFLVLASNSGPFALRSIEFTNVLLDESVIKAVAKLPCRLETLRFSNCDLHLSWLRSLLAGEATSDLQRLDLSSLWGENPIEGKIADLAPLRQLTSLREIVKTGTNLDTADVREALPGVQVVT